MTGLLLFTRSRRWLANIAIAAASAILISVCGPIGYSLNPLGGYLVAVAAQIPLINAIFTQASLTSSIVVQERYAARKLGTARTLHYVTVTLVAALALGTAASALNISAEPQLSSYSDFGSIAEVRNLLAFTGAAFVGSSAFGDAFGWTLPLAWSTLPFLVLRGPNSDPVGLLTLVIQPDDAFLPFITALILFILGAVLAASGWSIPRAVTSIRNRTGVAPRFDHVR